ncbi:hypothetical protein HZC07_03060 [Candidatus Micrarchaeota archaeon]|nr:hypothetical protein [Candidatus Micrarchaeota archaeon]
MKSVTIVADDRVGLLADISYILGKSGVNIDGLYVDVVAGKAVISLEIKDPRKASEVLYRNGFQTTNPEAIVIKISNNRFDDVTDLLQEEQIEVKTFSTLSSDAEEGIFAIHVDKPRKAFKVLTPFILGNTQPYY